MSRIALLVPLALAACASVPRAGLLTGDWGGTHVGLHLDPLEGKLDYDCAEGTIGPIAIRSDGSFVAHGMHTPGHGGPSREGETLPAYQARYTGTVRGNRMTLQARVANGALLGPFTLTRGAEPRIFRCL